MRVPPGANGELWCNQGTVGRSPFASCNLSPITNLMAANIIHNDTIMKNIFSKNWRVDLSIFYKRNVDKTRLLVASNQKSNSLSTLEHLSMIVTGVQCSPFVGKKPSLPPPLSVSLSMSKISEYLRPLILSTVSNPSAEGHHPIATSGRQDVCKAQVLTNYVCLSNWVCVLLFLFLFASSTWWKECSPASGYLCVCIFCQCLGLLSYLWLFDPVLWSSF